jgi:hypothetical protein
VKVVRDFQIKKYPIALRAEGQHFGSQLLERLCPRRSYAAGFTAALAGRESRIEVQKLDNLFFRVPLEVIQF